MEVVDHVELLKDEIDEEIIKPFPFKIKKKNKTLFMKWIPILKEMEDASNQDISTYSSCNEYYIHKKIMEEMDFLHIPKLILKECHLVANSKLNVFKTVNGKKRVSTTLTSIKETLDEYTYDDTQPYTMVYVSEWIDDSVDIDVLSEIIPKLSVDESIKSDIWRNIIFQVMYTLYILQKRYKFMHNDFHTNNILIKEVPAGGYIKYVIEGIEYFVPNIGYIVKITDFEWSTIENHPNAFYDQYITDDYCDKLDLFLFVACLLDCEISNDLREFILNSYGNEIFDECNENNYPNFEMQRLTSKGYKYYYNKLKSPRELLLNEYFSKFKKKEYMNPHN